jgi:hypothetical protein
LIVFLNRPFLSLKNGRKIQAMNPSPQNTTHTESLGQRRIGSVTAKQSGLVSVVAFCAAMCVSFCPEAKAAVVISGVANGSVAPVLNSNLGVMRLAFNLGNGGAMVRDGISFTNSGATGTTSVVYGSASGITVGASASPGVTFSNFATGLDPLFQTESYTSSNNPLTLNVTGLNPLNHYLIQIMHGENRGLTYNGGLITATDSLSNISSRSLTFGPGGSGNAFALVSIMVSGTTSLNYFMPAATRGPSVSGITIQTIPEPSHWMLLGLGLGAMIIRRRR